MNCKICGSKMEYYQAQWFGQYDCNECEVTYNKTDKIWQIPDSVIDELLNEAKRLETKLKSL